MDNIGFIGVDMMFPMKFSTIPWIYLDIYLYKTTQSHGNMWLPYKVSNLFESHLCVLACSAFAHALTIRLWAEFHPCFLKII